MARRTEFSNFGALGIALSAGGTALGVLQRMVRFHRLISNVVRTELYVDDSEVVIRFIPNGDHEPHPQAIQYVMASIVQLARSRIDSNLSPLRVTVTPSCSDYTTNMQKFFHCDVSIDDTYELVIDRAVADSSFKLSQPRLAEAMDRSLSEQLAEQEQSSIAVQLSLWLEETLPEGEPTLAQAADHLNMSARSLQRRLSEESLTFKAVLAQTRQSMVARYFDRGDISVTQAAFMLGFSDVSAFSRAFKKWYGVSPSQYKT